MRVQGTQQLGYISNGINLNTLGSFPQERAKEFYSYPRYYLFDFGAIGSSYMTSSPDINGNYWNNFTGIGTAAGGQKILNNIRTSKNVYTNINLSGYNTFNGAANFLGGEVNPDPNLLGDLAISSATRDYYYNFNAGDNIDFLISNLNQNHVYDFAFFGSRNTTQTRVTAYIVSGYDNLRSGELQTSGPGSSLSPLYSGNNYKIVYFDGVKPNSDNQIRFFLRTISGSFQHLNVMKIVERRYNLVFEDDFNGTTLNTSNWYAWDHYEGANGELQFYTSRTGISGNINISGSILHISARSGEYTAQGPWMPSPATTQFTSALIESLDKKEFQYGKIEARMKLPSGQGLWPAFWMLGSNYFDPGVGWPLCGEIDIMEHANVQPNYTAALHTFNRNHTIPAGGWVGATNITNYHTQFNVYGMEWTPEQISFYLNNSTFYTVTKAQAGIGQQNWPFDQPFWIKLNLAVGGSYGGSPNGGDWTKPHTMEVDWVRVYQK